MQVSGVGRVVFWDGGSIWIGRSLGVSEMHQHHAIQLSLGMTGPVQFRRPGNREWSNYDGVVIPPNMRHTFQAPGILVAHLFIEPESMTGRAILARFGTGEIAPIAPKLVRDLAAPLAAAMAEGKSDSELVALARRAFLSLSDGVGGMTPADPRVLRAIEVIKDRLDEPLTLGEIAKAAGLSKDRFRHLFVADTGISFRVYVLWARLNHALSLGYAGASWTEAAYAANFADSAHLTRTCRRMFGFAPSFAQVRAPEQARRSA